MPSERLTAASAARHRVQLLADQGGRCALCNELIATGEAVLDHDHTTGRVRGVLHRGCNAMLGHIENNRPRHKLTSVTRLAAWASNITGYIHRRLPDDTPLYPTYRTADQKRELRNARARKVRAAIKRGA